VRAPGAPVRWWVLFPFLTRPGGLSLFFFRQHDLSAYLCAALTMAQRTSPRHAAVAAAASAPVVSVVPVRPVPAAARPEDPVPLHDDEDHDAVATAAALVNLRTSSPLRPPGSPVGSAGDASVGGVHAMRMLLSTPPPPASSSHGAAASASPSRSARRRAATGASAGADEGTARPAAAAAGGIGARAVSAPLRPLPPPVYARSTSATSADADGSVDSYGGATEGVKGPWTKTEDDMLTSLVEEIGPRRWTDIAQRLGGRIAKQCRERYVAHAMYVAHCGVNPRSRWVPAGGTIT
jgi:hypothetical protein